MRAVLAGMIATAGADVFAGLPIHAFSPP